MALTLDERAAVQALRDEAHAARNLLERYGSEQAGREVPSEWRRRRTRTPGGCYQASGKWSGEDGAIYTEGEALPSSPRVWIPHAWLTDAEGNVIDLAWDEPGEIYRGVQIPSVVYAKVVRKLEMWAPVLGLLAAEKWTPDSDA